MMEKATTADPVEAAETAAQALAELAHTLPGISTAEPIEAAVTMVSSQAGSQTCDRKSDVSVNIDTTPHNHCRSRTGPPNTNPPSPKSCLSRISSITLNREKQWSIHWYLPFLMTILYVTGGCFALGHHLYYTSRDGQDASSYEWPVRFGTALAFITSNCLLGAAHVAYKQCAWHTLKRSPLKLATIDRIFAASRDPTEACNPEFVTKAPGQILIAAVCWLLPLAAIASPTALVVIPGSIITAETCDNVLSLDFSRENSVTAIDPSRSQSSINYWNITDKTPLMFYDMPSYDIMRMSTLSFASENGPLSASDPCPTGRNCTYNISFDGPAYKCEGMTGFDGTTEQRIDDLAPSGQVIYSGSQIVTPDKLDDYGIPVEWHNVTELDQYGIFTKEYPIWIGYVLNTTKLYQGPNETLWPYELERHVLQCTLNHARYDVSIAFINGAQVVNNTQIQHSGPIMPDGARITPRDETYKQFSAYHSLGYLFNKLLANTNVQPNASTYAYAISDISGTELVDRHTLLPVKDFPEAIERKFGELVLSLLNQPQFLAVYNMSVPCSIESRAQVWEYRPFWLVVTYSIATGTTLLVILAGSYALLDNGYGMDTSFSTILAVTRNRELDSLMNGCSLGRAPLPERILKTRFQFGETVGDDRAHGDGAKHAAFGFEGNVRSIMFGGDYC